MFMQFDRISTQWVWDRGQRISIGAKRKKPVTKAITSCIVSVNYSADEETPNSAVRAQCFNPWTIFFWNCVTGITRSHEHDFQGCLVASYTDDICISVYFGCPFPGQFWPMNKFTLQKSMQSTNGGGLNPFRHLFTFLSGDFFQWGFNVL